MRQTLLRQHSANDAMRVLLYTRAHKPNAKRKCAKNAQLQTLPAPGGVHQLPPGQPGPPEGM